MVFYRCSVFNFSWPFTWGYGVLLGATALSGSYINQKYRQLFKLGNTGKITSFLPIVAVPPFLALLCHQGLVTKKILIGEFPCHICATVKSGTIQAVTGCVYPLLTATIYTAVLAKNYTTYPLPSLTEPLRFVTSIFKMSSPLRRPLLLMIIAQYLLGTAIVAAQLNTYENVLLQESPEEQSYPEEKYD